MIKAHIIAPGDVVMIQTPHYGREDTVKYYMLDEYKENLIEVGYLEARNYQKAESHDDYWDLEEMERSRSQPEEKDD